MKNFNRQILEAVNRGIKLALDDYEDAGPISFASPTGDAIEDEEAIKDKINLYKFFVDLGLPSGTIWCKYNVGVNPNELTRPIDWRGNFYSWGETETKDDYVLEKYKFVKIDDLTHLTKYHIRDNKNRLELIDDVAYQNPIKYKGRTYQLQIPSVDAYTELLKYTKREYVQNYKGIENLNVDIYTSIINGCKIVFPHFGYKEEQGVITSRSNGYYWTNELTLSNQFKAYSFHVNSTYVSISHTNFRAHGLNIRAVLL